MGLFIVFDDTVKVDALPSLCRGIKVSEITLCPLTHDVSILNRIKGALTARENVSVRSIDTAKVVGERVVALRERICKWSADIGESKVNSRQVKEWFMLPGLDVSAWWLGLLSEKNTLKTDLFFRMAQVHAVREFLASGEYDLCAVAISEPGFRKAICNVARELGLRILELPAVHSGDIKSKVKNMVASLGTMGMMIRGIGHWTRMIRRGRMARKYLGSRAQRLPDSDALLFVSYFPAVDKKAAGEGIFKNKYALPLQEKLNKMRIPIVWLLLTVPFEGYNYYDSVRLAEKFTGKGEKLFLIEEFLTVGVAAKSLFLWLRQLVISFYIFHYVKRTCLAAEPVGKACGPFVSDLWRLSFCGPIAIEGMVYALIFRKVFSELFDISDCLYICEMLAWEKALNAAKSKINPRVRTIAFQHTSVSKNDLSYFYDGSETMRSGNPSDMPLPDVLACNGEHIYSLLSKCGYHGMTVVEAVRYMYLDRILSLDPGQRKGRPVLLIAGPYKKEEAKAVFSLAYAAFPRAEQFDIWFKGHPSMPCEDVFRELAIDISETGYVICNGNISEYFEHAWAVLVSTSTVSLEALAFGCEVILPVLADVMLINPLSDFEDYYHNVTTPQELRMVMQKITGGFSLYKTEEYKAFVRSYWTIDPRLPLWTRLLGNDLSGKHQSLRRRQGYARQ